MSKAVSPKSIKAPTIGLMYFSPTGSTRKVCEAIATAISSNPPVRFDLTKPSNLAERQIEKADLWIVGAPVYESRLARLARERLKEALSANPMAETPSIAIVVCGNVHTGIALSQLVGILDEKNLKVIGAGEFIGEHNLLPRIVGYSYGKGRPDSADLQMALEFGNAIQKKGLSGPEINFDEIYSNSEKIPFMFKVAGEGSAKRFVGQILVDAEKCTKCEECVAACPVGCLDQETFLKIDKQKNTCIGCMACIKACPVGARTQMAKSQSFAKLLFKPEQIRREPKYYV
jgi:ferredoxin/flavodoxin